MRFFCAAMSYYVLFSNHEATHLYRVSQYNRILNLRIYLSLTCVFALAIGAKCKQCASAIVIPESARHDRTSNWPALKAVCMESEKGCLSGLEHTSSMTRQPTREYRLNKSTKMCLYMCVGSG